MVEAWYKHKELVLIKDVEGIFVVSCIKHVTSPEGVQRYMYQLQDREGNLYKEGSNSWIVQKRLTKILQPSKLAFVELKTMLCGVIERGDFE
jgi:hypothetical protein